MNDLNSHEQSMPNWMRRGLPGMGHAALAPLVGTWRVDMKFYATFGRSPDDPPIIAEGFTCKREWVADGRYLEDLTEGSAIGAPYWRKGWLGYSNMDERYEWVTIDAVNSDMMIYAGHAIRSNPNRFVIYEVWKDISSLRDHFKKPFVQQFVADTENYVDRDMQTEWLIMASDYHPGK